MALEVEKDEWRTVPGADRPGETGLGDLLARGAALVCLIQVGGAAVSYVAQVLLARWLGPSEYGVYALVITVVTLLAVLGCFGLSGTVVRFVPQYLAQGRWGHCRGIIRRGWQVTGLAGCAMAVLGATVLLVINAMWGMDAFFPFLVGMGMVPVLALITYQSALLRSLRHMVSAYGPPQVLRPLFLGAAAFLFLRILDYRPSVSALLAAALAVGLSLAIQLGIFKRRLPPAVRGASSEYDTRTWFHVALPLLAIAGLGLMARRVSILLIGGFLGPQEVGFYHAASRTSDLVTFALMAVNGIAAPVFASLIAQDERDRLQETLITVAHLIFWPALAGAGLLVVYGESLLGFFGAEFTAARSAMIILIIGKVVSVGAGSVMTLLNVSGHQVLSARVYGVSVLLQLTLTAIAIPFLGITGAALGSALATISWNIWLYRIVVERIGVRPSIIVAVKSYIERKR